MGHEPESDGRRGPDAARTILGRETADFPGRLGIQHRDVPFAVANGVADAGLIVHHLALYYDISLHPSTGSQPKFRLLALIR
jgi:hypothetical protein